MKKENERKSDLREIPGVGKTTEEDLRQLGIRCVADLKGQDPEGLYRRDCVRRGFQIDRCQLYVYRLAVYYAEHEERDPELLRWWKWKDRSYPPKQE